MCSVLFIKESAYETSQLISEYEPNTFFYSFEYEGRNSMCNIYFVGDQLPIPNGYFFCLTNRKQFIFVTSQVLFLGVCHSDDLIYLFVIPFPSIPSGLNISETKLSKKMLQTWTNFVKYG